MASPSAFRLAVEACRPSKSSVLRTRPLLQNRRFTSGTRPFASTPINSDFLNLAANQSQRARENVQDTPQRASDEISSSAQLQDSATTSRTAASSPQIPPWASQKSEAINTPQQDSIQTRPNVSLSTSKPLPPNVLAIHLNPMRHKAQYGLPVASLQLRSYSVRNLEFFADFILRAAFYLKLPGRGPVPLPRRRERWTVLKSNFVHKKAQENFQRITYKRLITIYDGHPEVVERWLAFVRKHQFYGVGMKANVWDFSSLDVGAAMDQTYKSAVEKELSEKLADFGFNKDVADKGASVERLLRREGTKVQGVPMAEIRERSLTESEKRWVQGLPEESDR